jgi:hypothetical protein
MDPNISCPHQNCIKEKISGDLWDNPLDFTDVPKEEEAPSLFQPFSIIANFISQKLDASLDSSAKTLFKQALPINTLKLKGCSCDQLIAESGTKLFDIILETKYSADNLKALGFTWEKYLLAGFSPSHFKAAKVRFNEGLYTVIIQSVANLMVLCSGDHESALKLGVTPREWKLLCPSALAPAFSLAQNGFNAGHIVAMDYSLAQWKTDMGLTRSHMTQNFKFSTDNFLEFIHQDRQLAAEFISLFNFNPFNTYFSKNEHVRNPFI